MHALFPIISGVAAETEGPIWPTATTDPSFLQHVLCTCGELGDFGLIGVEAGEANVFAPVFRRRFDLREFVPGSQPNEVPAGACGTLLFLGTPFDQPYNSACDVLEAGAGESGLHSELCRLARKLDCSGVVLLGVPDVAGTPPAPGWVWERYLPETVLPVSRQSVPDFVHSLGTKSRSNFRRRLRRIEESNVLVEERRLDSDITGELYDCYSKTYERAPLKWLKMPRAYFQRDAWTDASVTVLLAKRGEKIVGFTMMVAGPEGWANHRMGLAYDQADTSNEYFAMLFASYACAIKRGVKRIILGPTAYDTKLRLRAELIPRAMAFNLFDPAVSDWFRAALKRTQDGFFSDLRRW